MGLARFPDRRGACRIILLCTHAHRFSLHSRSEYKDGLALPHLPFTMKYFHFFRLPYFFMLRAQPVNTSNLFRVLLLVVRHPDG